MCIVIDTNCIGDFMNANEHPYILPVKEWLLKHKHAKMVYGGNKYIQEIKKHKEFVTIQHSKKTLGISRWKCKKKWLTLNDVS